MQVNQFNPNELKSILFSSCTGWNPQHADEKAKCISSGKFGMLMHKDKVNAFLTSHQLPEATHIQQEEFEGILKNYLVLFVKNDLWQQKIKPVIDFYQAYEGELKKCTSAVEFQSKLALMNIELPEKDLLTTSIQEVLDNLGVFKTHSKGSGSLLDQVGDRYGIWY